MPKRASSGHAVELGAHFYVFRLATGINCLFFTILKHFSLLGGVIWSKLIFVLSLGTNLRQFCSHVGASIGSLCTDRRLRLERALA